MTRTNGTYHLHGRVTRMRAVGIAGIIAAVFVVLTVAVFPRGADAQTAPSLGGAESFAVLGGSTVTNTGPTIVYGDLGVSPGTAITGFSGVQDGGPGTVNGEVYTGSDGPAVNARTGVTAAYGVLAGQECDENLTAVGDLGGLTLVEGVYCFDTSAGMTGTLTLDGQGNPDAVFIIRTGSTLTTASASSVNLVNQANACNVFWQIGSSATLGTTTSFAGNILTTASITLDTGATITGRALAGEAGAVTMDSNVVDARSCVAPTEETPTPTVETPTPEPATATAVAEATATAIAEATLTPVPPATATAVAEATATAIAEATLTPVPPATATAIAEATATAIAEATPTTAAQQTATVAAPGAPGTGSGPPSGPAPSLSFAVAGAVLLLMGASGLVALTTRRGGRNSRSNGQ